MKDRFDYFYGGESEQFSFYRIPRQLIVGQGFKHVSTDAKLPLSRVAGCPILR